MMSDLTIRPRARTELVTPIPQTRCFVCYHLFRKKKQNQKVCSKLCKNALNMARVKVRRLREQGIGDDGKLPCAICVICKEPFERKQVNFVTCGKKECIRQRNILTNKKWSKKNEEPPIAKCVSCGEPFKQRQPNYVVCGKAACKRLRSVELNKRRREWPLPRRVSVEVPKQ